MWYLIWHLFSLLANCPCSFPPKSFPKLLSYIQVQYFPMLCKLNLTNCGVVRAHTLNPHNFIPWTLSKNTDHESNFNVQDVWKLNYTGAGVVVAVVDEGLDPTHPELSRNYVSSFSSSYHVLNFSQKCSFYTVKTWQGSVE